MKKILLFVVALCLCYIVSLCVEKYKKYEIDENLRGKVTKIVIEKQNRKLLLYHNDRLLKIYSPIALGGNPIGHKQFEGDSKTPEGLYYIDSKNPKSRYFLNLGISYPNKKDKQYAKSHGRSAGGDIKIHGLPNGMNIAKKVFESYGDWTDGCIALDNESIKELYEVVPIGTPILIKP